MGMFDWYVPHPPLPCPKCDTTLSGWQGKSGPCLLLEWKQGVAHPSRPGVALPYLPYSDSERLIRQFELYTQCAVCEAWINAVGSCDGDVWTHVRLLLEE